MIRNKIFNDGHYNGMPQNEYKQKHDSSNHTVIKPHLIIGGWVPKNFEVTIDYNGKKTILHIPYNDCHEVLEILNNYLSSHGIHSYVEHKFDNNKKGGNDGE